MFSKGRRIRYMLFILNAWFPGLENAALPLSNAESGKGWKFGMTVGDEMVSLFSCQKCVLSGLVPRFANESRLRMRIAVHAF